jgi:predicted lipoprotein with Yx(FWY)xxD motif
MQRYSLLLSILITSFLFSGCSAGIDLFSQAVDKTAPKEEVVDIGPSFAPVESKYIEPVGWVLVSQSGKTLYTFSEDEPYLSSCYGECAIIWQPFLISYPEAVSGKYQYIERSDGNMQVTLDGQPLYFYTPDTKGTATGDGKDGLWGVVSIEE